MATARYPSPTNVYIPSFEATGAVISFTRDPAKFKINRYVEKKPTSLPVGVYLKLDFDEPTRVVTDEEFAWEDGDERPAGNNNIGNFSFEEFKTARRDYPWTLGWQTIRHATWKIKAFQSRIMMTKAMTNRTWRVVRLLETTGGWGANTADANTLNGGAGGWDTASDDPTDTNYLAIQKSIDEAVRRVFLGTNSCVGYEDLRLLISPGAAIAMANSAEIHNYLRESPFAMSQVQGALKASNPNGAWGLPTHYAGVDIVVEDATRVSNRPGGTLAKAFIKSDTSAVLLSRPGELDGGEVGTSGSFSTLQWFYYSPTGELKVESFDDAENERHKGHVVEQFKEVLAAPPSGFLITSIT